MLQNLDFESIDELGRNISERYIREEIDAAYIVYNEFKSVLAQRVVVEKILPIIEVGKQQIASAQEMTRKSESMRGEAAISAGVSLIAAGYRRTG